MEVVRTKILCRWPFDNLEVSERCKLNRQVLKRLLRLVDEEHIENNVKLMNLYIRFSVDRIRESCELHNPTKLRREIFNSCFAHGLLNIQFNFLRVSRI